MNKPTMCRFVRYARNAMRGRGYPVSTGDWYLTILTRWATPTTASTLTTPAWDYSVATTIHSREQDYPVATTK